MLRTAGARSRVSAIGVGRHLPRQLRRRGITVLEGNTVRGDWFVIPGSGTGQLAGLRGEGGFHADLGEGAQVHLSRAATVRRDDPP
jgi:hypothetical protein